MLTVYIKKRAFWALRGENASQYLDKGEKMFLRATKLLFEKKCSQIASYEALTKLQTLINEESEIDADRAAQMVEYIEEAIGGMKEAAANDYNIAATTSNYDPTVLAAAEEMWRETEETADVHEQILGECRVRQ